MNISNIMGCPFLLKNLIDCIYDSLLIFRTHNRSLLVTLKFAVDKSSVHLRCDASSSDCNAYIMASNVVTESGLMTLVAANVVTESVLKQHF